MSDALVRKAFETVTETWSASNGVLLVPENAVMSVTGTYAQMFLLRAPTRVVDFFGALRSYRGIFQVTLFLPINTGPAAADGLVKSLHDAFPLTAPMQPQTGFRVWLLEPMSAAPPIPDPSRYIVPVSAPYEAH